MKIGKIEFGPPGTGPFDVSDLAAIFHGAPAEAFASKHRSSMLSAPVIAYVAEEVRRQGHDLLTRDGIERVQWMLDGWLTAMKLAEEDKARPEPWGIAWFHIQDIGSRVEVEKNRTGFRDCEVRVGSRKCPAASRVRGLLNELLSQQKTLTPIEFYKAFEEVHPFRDGNGRTGKILLNWLNGTLLEPIFPPADLWGRPIQNP